MSDKAINDYLTMLHSPDRLVDPNAIETAEKALEEADNYVERLLARQHLNDVRVPNIEQVTEAFVEEAKGWAEKNNVSADTFIAEGVSADVLKDAGFTIPLKERQQPKRQIRRKRVTQQQIRDRMPSTSPFSVADVVEQTGASNAPARKVVYGLLDEGLIEELGPDPDHDAPGRAPTLYRWKS